MEKGDLDLIDSVCSLLTAQVLDRVRSFVQWFLDLRLPWQFRVIAWAVATSWCLFASYSLFLYVRPFGTQRRATLYFIKGRCCCILRRIHPVSFHTKVVKYCVRCKF